MPTQQRRTRGKNPRRRRPRPAPEPIPEGSVVVYTDGACRGNPGPGGWGWVIPDGDWAFGSDRRTTNQRMEVTAALRALETVQGPMAVFSDSTYVVNCFRDRWHEGWVRNDWKNSKKQPVANRDLWEPLIGLYLPRREEIQWRWVRGHSQNKWNDTADRLAVHGAQTQTSGAGSGEVP